MTKTLGDYEKELEQSIARLEKLNKPESFEQLRKLAKENKKVYCDSLSEIPNGWYSSGPFEIQIL